MRLKSCVQKKIWVYGYTSLGELVSHTDKMKGFQIEKIDPRNLEVEFSQTTHENILGNDNFDVKLGEIE